MTQATATAIALPDKNSETLSNFDRLRSHLKTESLAHALLEAWKEAPDGSDKGRLMIDTLENFYNSKQEENEQGTTEEN